MRLQYVCISVYVYVYVPSKLSWGEAASRLQAVTKINCTRGYHCPIGYIRAYILRSIYISCIYVYIHIYVHTYIHISCIFDCLPIHLAVCMYVCLYKMYVCMRMYVHSVHNQYLHVFRPIHI